MQDQDGHVRLILHSMLATKMGQVPAESYTKDMKHTNARSHDSKELLNDKCGISSNDVIILWSKKMALFGVALLYHSHRSAAMP